VSFVSSRGEKLCRVDPDEDPVVVELKSIERVLRVHEAQLLSYLKLSQRPVGLLINFNVVHLRDGITRKVL
jgi:GxxExxY protein